MGVKEDDDAVIGLMYLKRIYEYTYGNPNWHEYVTHKTTYYFIGKTPEAEWGVNNGFVMEVIPEKGWEGAYGVTITLEGLYYLQLNKEININDKR